MVWNFFGGYAVCLPYVRIDHFFDLVIKPFVYSQTKLILLRN